MTHSVSSGGLHKACPSCRGSNSSGALRSRFATSADVAVTVAVIVVIAVAGFMLIDLAGGGNAENP